MPENHLENTTNQESLFLNEHLMTLACVLVTLTSLVSMVLGIAQKDSFAVFEVLVRLVTAVAMYLSFRFYKWDVAKGLMGGVLFCLMYHEAHLVIDKLWGEQDFDIYLVSGIQGSLYLSAAGMTFLMTVIITINHFFINYASHGNPKDVIFNRIAIFFKLAVSVLLVASNGRLGLPSSVLWRNALQSLTDIFLILLLVTIESHFDFFNTIRRDLHILKREGRKHR